MLWRASVSFTCSLFLEHFHHSMIVSETVACDTDGEIGSDSQSSFIQIEKFTCASIPATPPNLLDITIRIWRSKSNHDRNLKLYPPISAWTPIRPSRNRSAGRSSTGSPPLNLRLACTLSLARQGSQNSQNKAENQNMRYLCVVGSFDVTVQDGSRCLIRIHALIEKAHSTPKTALMHTASLVPFSLKPPLLFMSQGLSWALSRTSV
ncbi:hypothetical protein BJX61DRAFT_356240 [Aspergillus egyptiacus]|nr:hypothetical protein BJX61DRAFT_356240 [Aspergillus egyptiacus]